MASAPPNTNETQPPKAIIAPHAGYIYSGPVAASAYRRVEAGRGRFQRVVLIGPSHRVGFRGLGLSSNVGFATPLGVVPVDQEAWDVASRLPAVDICDAAHRQEHSLEVHLPFLEEVLGEFKLMPIVVGDATPDEVAAVIDALWGGPETLVVISSDLSHYLGYDEAVAIDKVTAAAIEAMRPDRIAYEQACGRLPVNGLLVAAKRRGMTVSTVDLRNSGDTAGSRDRVVGYGSFLFAERADASS